MIFRRSLIFFFVAFLMCGAFASNKDRSNIELEKFDERIQKIENEVALQRQIQQINSDSNEKRISDLGTLATNQGTQATNTATLLGALITFAVLVAGISIYINSVKTAKNQVEKYLEENSSSIKERMAKLAQDAEAGSANIIGIVTGVGDDAKKAFEQIMLFKEGAAVLINKSSDANSMGDMKNPHSFNAVMAAYKTLQNKSEVNFDAFDRYTRGLAQFATKNYEAALGSFQDATMNEAGVSESMRAEYLLAQAAAFRELGRTHEEISIYNRIDSLYGTSTEALVFLVAARALTNKAVSLAQHEDIEASLAVSKTIWERYSSHIHPEIRVIVAQSVLNAATELTKHQRFIDSDNKCVVIQDFYENEINVETREIVAKSFLLRAKNSQGLGQYDDATVLFSHIRNEYNLGESKEMADVFANLNNAQGIGQIMLAKLNWGSELLRTSYLQSAMATLGGTFASFHESDYPAIIGNMGYASFLRGNYDYALYYTESALNIGNLAQRSAQRELLMRNSSSLRLESVDSSYEYMVDTLGTAATLN